MHTKHSSGDNVGDMFAVGPKGKPHNAGGVCFFNAEWRGALDSANAKLKKENAELKKNFGNVLGQRNRLYKVCDDYDNKVNKLEDENKNLHNTIDALERKCEAWGVGETSETVMMSDANYRKLRDKMTDLEKERDNAFRVLNLRDERIKQLETRELELAEKIDNRNLPPQNSITDKPRHIKNLGIDRDGNVVVFTHHLDKVRK